MIGRTLNGVYRLLDRVGCGGFAEVYLARDLRANTVVAVKILHAHFARDPRIVQRFAQEAELARVLVDPRIVRVLDAGQEAETHYIVMEYVQGHTLAEVLRSRGPLPIEEAVRYVSQALRALEVAHQAEIVHRDIKPQNLMLTPDGTVKVMDFGIAKHLAIGSLTGSGRYLGTPQYMSPDQASGRSVDARSDLYSTAITLFELLTGSTPFDAANPLAVLHLQITAEPPLLGSRLRDAPSGLERVIARALAKSPADRFPSAAAMLAALEEAVEETQRGEVKRSGDRSLRRLADGPEQSDDAGLASESRPFLIPFAWPVVSTPAWQVFAGDQSAPGRFLRPVGLAVDRQDNLYVADRDNHRIQKLSPDAEPLEQWGGAGSGPGEFFYPVDVAVDGAGNVYVADSGNTRIQMLSPRGQSAAEWDLADSFDRKDWRAAVPPYRYYVTGVAIGGQHDLFAVAGGSLYKLGKDRRQLKRWGQQQGFYRHCTGIRGVAVARDGAVYVTAMGLGVFKLSPVGRLLGPWGTLREYGSLAGWEMYWVLDDPLDWPNGVAVDDGDSVYELGGRYDPSLARVDPSGTVVWRVRSEGLGFPLDATGRISVDSRGNVWVSNTDACGIAKVSPDGRLLGVVGAPVTLPGSFFRPKGVAVDVDGRYVYVADTGNHRIQQLSPYGQALGVWGSEGSAPGQFQDPRGIAVDPLLPGAVIYVADSGNHRIQALSPSGTVLAVWGSEGGGPGQFDCPSDVAVDGQSNVYVADSGNNRVQKLSPSGRVLAVWGLDGDELGKFRVPSGIAVDGLGNVYVADSGNHRVQKLSAWGRVLTAWHTTGDGTWPSIGLPKGVAVDTHGRVYVAETDTHRVKMFSPSGHLLDVWGGDDQGTGHFGGPVGLAVDQWDNVYVADWERNRIQALIRCDWRVQT